MVKMAVWLSALYSQRPLSLQMTYACGVICLVPQWATSQERDIGSILHPAGEQCHFMGHPGCDAVHAQACHISKIAQKGWAMATLPDLMNGWQAGAPPSAMLAMRTLHAAQRFACLACLQQVLPHLALLTPACPLRLSSAPLHAYV